MKKTTFLKLAVIASTMLLLASCSSSKEHVHTIVPVKIKAATLTAEGYEAHWKCSECRTLFRDETEKQKTTLEALVIPKGFAKLNDGTVKTNTGGSTGAFAKASSSNPVTVNGFYMAMTATTYERWYEVYAWATADERGANKYTFINKGREGHDGTDGAEPTDASKEPVTCISWRDAVVWCNAASEMEGKTPVYYIEGTFTSDKVLRKSEDKSVAAGSGKAEKAVINENANGYRLPTQAEWEYAARGGNPGSPEWSYKYAGTNSESNLVNYAVYKDNSGSKTADVGTKNANSAGLYDMSGNVFEWVQDILYLSGVMRVRMSGGCYTNIGSYTAVDWCVDYNPYSSAPSAGFRVCLSSGSN